MRERYFGVEIEHGNSSGCEAVNIQLRDTYPWLYRPGHKGLGMSVGYDGSGVEVRTPPLIGAEGFRTLRSLFAFLKKIGGYTTNADGMHVHFDAPEFIADPSLIVVLAKNWVANEAQLRPFVHERRHVRGSCPSNLATIRDRIWDSKTQTYKACPTGTTTLSLIEERIATGGTIGEIVSLQGDRGALNLQALNGHGTIEVRLHEGTLDYTQAAAWIRFCIAFINASADGRLLRTCDTPVELLNEIKPHYTAKQQLARRAAGEVVYA